MFSFSRRINGKTYYVRLLVSTLLLLGVAALGDLVLDKESPSAILGVIILALIVVVWPVFLISQVRQRANDIGKHPLIMTIIAWCTPLFLFLGFIPGQKTANRYGPVPRKDILI